ncbi:MAG: transporter [Sphingomonas sp.]|uniref:hypothetical protein n=1 Tax=Sphingomonas sp. TaxID=28214 RepID=UPI00183B61A7|nr:hypothetical protein [Sphingomonas sp.]MBA3667916.1 transporter [Sphingomonas sp.]
MQSARWTGPLLASTPETLPQGHFYTEPYFFDVISGGKHHPGSSGYYQYGLAEDFTIGFQPDFAIGTESPNRSPAIGDFKLLSQLRLTHFTPEHRVPSVAVILQEVIPTGKHDRLGPLHEGHGSGSFATEVGVNVQYYFLLKNDRLLRARLNFLQRFPHGSDVEDRSVYGTGPGFRGHAKPGATTTFIGAVEYSVTREWVLALDVTRQSTTQTKVRGRYNGGPLIEQTSPSSHFVSFAPAVEYNWSDRTGAIFGLWVIPKGHNTPASITPALAISRFW